MFNEVLAKAAANAVVKAEMVKNKPARYLVLSALAGFYVGMAIFLIYSVGAPLVEADWPIVKLVMGLSFAMSLVLVVFAGSELFTGNTMFMTIGLVRGKVSPIGVCRVLGMSYLGNLLGSILLAMFVYLTGLLSVEPMQGFVSTSVLAKMTLPAGQLFFRGVLCNMFVCLALWMGMRVKDETPKIIFIFLCLFGFISSSYEHSIANMSLMCMGMLANYGDGITTMGYVYNLAVVTLGNIFGGAVMVAGAYLFISGSKS